MTEEEKEEKEEKEWETRYKKIVGTRMENHKKKRGPKLNKKITAGKLSGGTEQKNVSGRRVNCLMCGIKLHLREMHEVGYGGYYCPRCAKHRGLI